MTVPAPDPRTDERVLIILYDPDWPALFEAEKSRLLAAAPEAVAGVHHVGSTSVPGLAAKPVIDVLLVLHRPLDDGEIDRVATGGFEYRGEYRIAGRQYFSRREAPAVHVHAFVADHPDIDRMVAFRDYLRAHPNTAREYEALKWDLAARLDRASYTEAKTDFIRAVERLAGRQT